MESDHIADPSGDDVDDPLDPVVERLRASRVTLILGLIAAIVFTTVGMLLTGIIPGSRSQNLWLGWPVLTFSALVLGATLRQLVWPVALIEVTKRGLRLRVRAPMSRGGLLFVPWSHVRSVVLTRVATTRGARAPALGLEILQDQAIRLPGLKWNSAQAAPEAPQCDVVFAASMMEGDVAEAVKRIDLYRREAQQR
jgi:hypothetical protein